MWKPDVFVITDEYEDIHSFVEANLIDRLGDTGKKLHTGRSRNDQVALDMRLYTREEAAPCGCALKGTARHDITYHGAEYGDDYAGFYPSAERHSRSRSRITWGLILRCLRETACACMTSTSG